MLRDQEADFILQNNKVVYPPVSTDGLELYYDVKGKKNSDLHKDKLLDMSGNGRHGELHDFNYKNLSGYQEDSELVFDGIDDNLKMSKLNGIDANNFTYQLNNNILAFTGDEVKTVKNGDIEVGGRNLLRNSNFRNSGEHWTPRVNPLYEIKDNVVLSGGESAYIKLLQNLGQSIVSGDVYYARAEVRALSNFYRMQFQLGPVANWGNSFGLTKPIKDEWVIVSGIVEAGFFDEYTFAIASDNRSNYDSPLWETKREVQLINLTATFGRGNEPSKEEADELFRVWTPAPEDLIETTELKGNILGDMEDIIDDHTRDEQSGVEVFTDKADDSLVRVEIDGKSVGGGSGKNLFQKKGIELGANSLGDGIGVTLSKNSRITRLSTKLDNYSPVKPNTEYTVSWKIGNIEVGQTDSSNAITNVSSGWKDSSPFTFTTGESTTRVHFNISKKDNSNILLEDVTDWEIQLEEGSTATTYEPPAPTPVHPIEIHSLNDFDVVSQKSEGGVIDGVEIGGRNYIRNDKWQGVAGGSVNEVDGALVVGEITNSGSSRISNTSLDGVKLPKTTLLSFEAKADVSEEAYIDFRGEESMRSIFFYTPTTEWQQYSFTVDSDGMILSHLYFRIRGGLGDKLYLRNVKVEFGTLHSSWTPAPEDIAESDNHPLIDKISLLLSEPLRSVGDVKDRLFRDSDGLWKVERNVHSITFKGTTGENWYFSVNSTESRANPEFNLVSGGYPQAVYSATSVESSSTHFLMRKVERPKNYEGRIAHGTYLMFSVPKSEYPNVDSWRNMLSQNNSKGTPLTVQYHVETPTVETLDQELQDKLNNLRSFQDSNYVYTIINNKTDIIPSHISENLKPTIHTEFLAKDHYKESRTVNNLLIWNRSLEDEELLNQNKLFHGRFNMRSNTIKDEPINQEINLLSGGVFGHSLEQNYTIEI